MYSYLLFCNFRRNICYITSSTLNPYQSQSSICCAKLQVPSILRAVNKGPKTHFIALLVCRRSQRFFLVYAGSSFSENVHIILCKFVLCIVYCFYTPSFAQSSEFDICFLNPMPGHISDQPNGRSESTERSRREGQVVLPVTSGTPIDHGRNNGPSLV